MNPSEHDWLMTLKQEQRSRWEKEQARVEVFVQSHPRLRDDADALMELLYNEIVLRELRGETPCELEYVARFPQLANEIREQFEAHRLIAECESASRTNDDVPLSSPKATPTLPEGYVFRECLGQGGMGVVYRVHQIRLKRDVALKMVLVEMASQDLLDRFRKEAEALARLQHPNIVQVFDTGEIHAQPWFTMELVEGSTLHEKLKAGPLPAREAAALIETLARAMHVAHTRGIIHRDLKPENVLLMADGTPKIGDFGLSRLLEPRNDESPDAHAEFVGSPYYAAPEQVPTSKGPHEIGPGTDVYALGAILYHALTGRPPFLGSFSLEILLQVSTQSPIAPRRLRSDLSPDLEAICLKCLEKDPAKRYDSALELALDLARFSCGLSVVARPVGPLARAGKWVKRRPLIAGLAVAVLLSLTGGVLVATTFAIQESQARQAESTAREKAERRLGHSLQFVREVLLDRAYPHRIQHKDFRWEEMNDILEVLQEMRKDEPDSYETLFALAFAQLVRAEKDPQPGLSDEQEKSLKEAITHFRNLEIRDPTDPIVRLNRSVALRVLGERMVAAKRHDEAVDALRFARVLLLEFLLRPGHRLDDMGLEEMARMNLALAQVGTQSQKQTVGELLNNLEETARNLEGRLYGVRKVIEKDITPSTPRYMPAPESGVWSRYRQKSDDYREPPGPPDIEQVFRPSRAQFCAFYLRTRQAQIRLVEQHASLQNAQVLMNETLDRITRWEDTLEDASVKAVVETLKKEKSRIDEAVRKMTPTRKTIDKDT